MKKILVPTDFSTYADAALQFATSIAKKHQAEVVLMHVLITPVNWSKLNKEQEKLYPETKSAINKAKEELAKRIKGVQSSGLEARSHIHYSDGKELVVNYLGMEHIDLIVMGSHGKYGFKEHVLGSNTYTILRKSGIPVFVVKENHGMTPLKKVVLATDFKAPSGKAFRDMIDVIKMMGSNPELLYVNTPSDFLEDEQIRELGEEFLKKFGPYSFPMHIYSAYRVERGIIQFAQREMADAVAVITHGRNDLQQLFSPSVVENLISYLDLPVLSLKVTEMD